MLRTVVFNPATSTGVDNLQQLPLFVPTPPRSQLQPAPPQYDPDCHISTGLKQCKLEFYKMDLRGFRLKISAAMHGLV